MPEIHVTKHYVRFTETRTTVEAEPQTFAKDRVYELPEASCERWKRRRVAVDATEADFSAQAKADVQAAKKKPKEAAVQTSGQAGTNTTPEAEAGTAAGPAGDTTSPAGISEANAAPLQS